MKRGRSNDSLSYDRESGAALVTVILVSLLLGTACIAMLTAVGASSRNNTDSLTEYKAYYAAESGIQAAVNVFRYRNVTYDLAVQNPTLGYNASTFPQGLNYTNGKVVVNGETAYSIQVSDPDNSSGAITYSSAGSFQQADGTYAATRTVTSGGVTVTFSFVPQGTSTMNHPVTRGQPFGSIQVTKSGSGTFTLANPLNFRIDFIMWNPRPGTRTINGSIGTNGVVSFTSATSGQPTFPLMGGTLTLCASNAGCTAPSYTVNLNPAGTANTDVFGKMTPIVPYRLRVVSTGYGPYGSKKQLEAIVQRNPLNDVGSTNAITMLGPGASLIFNPGTANTLDITGGGGPSIGVSDAQGLTTVTTAHTNGTLSPPPAIFSNDLPDWQQSPAALDTLVRQLRTAAQNSGRYFPGGPTSTQGWGNYSAGTGLTFCEGSCTLGSDGGGVLVVTGTLSMSGNIGFRGLILVTGRNISSGNPGGISRSGNGNATLTGNVVIAPYDPNNLAAGWYSPRYDQNGGAGDVINSSVNVDQAFNGTSAITDLVLGIAEK